MNSTLDAFLRSWPFDPLFLFALLLTAAIYLRGHAIFRRRDPARWHGGQVVAFLGGLGTVYLALASPIEPFASLLLQVHMVQHLLLMMAAPPLIWLGEPLFPLLAGLPKPIRTYWIAPLFRSPFLRWLFSRLTDPFVALPVYVAVTWLWHAPALYELALRSPGWHYVQHVCFLVSALLFWYPIVRPYPSKSQRSLWVLFPYLILADVQNTILSALLTFSSQVLYRYYLEVPRIGDGTALDDQATAGVIMWVPGSIAFLLPLFSLAIRLLSGSGRKKRQAARRDSHGRISLSLVTDASTHQPTGFDLLRVPVLGRFLKWRYARICLQLPLLLLAGFVIYDGLTGPEVAPMNLAGVLPWIHWRGLLIFVLLVAGNIFCMGCPFLLPRTLARHFLPAGRNWPRWLRSKWLAVVLLVLFLWSYEAFSLWDSPWLTAWIAIAYFAGAFLIDGLFRGAAFCKYVCPIGQFNFVQSLVSPLEIKARDPAVCAACTTKDCIRGRDGIPGCELHLFVPRKASNMDCTTCLDCVHACPHDNVGLIATPAGAELWSDRQRSGIGRFSKRPDLAALVLVLVFGAFANAAGMVEPVVQAARLHENHILTTSLFYLLSLFILPLTLVSTAAVLSRRWGELKLSNIETATRFAYALVPLGFGMWLAHYGFHFLTSYDTIVPTTQRFASDMGWTSISDPDWICDCCRPARPWLLHLEILFLDLSLLLSLYVGYRIAIAVSPRPAVALRMLGPWAAIMLALFAAGVWIVFQPMQMRGTMPG
jgi:cytochrome c oxidase assembly factor CtaG/ferredoxin